MQDNSPTRRRRPRLRNNENLGQLFSTAISPDPDASRIAQNNLASDYINRAPSSSIVQPKVVPDETFNDFKSPQYKGRTNLLPVSDQQRGELRKLLGTMMDEDTISKWFPGIPNVKR